MTHTYTIAADAWEALEAKLLKLKKKADAYSKELSWTIGAPYAKEIKVYDGFRVVGRYDVLAQDLAMTSDWIRKDGFTVLAKLDRVGDVNVVRKIDRDTEASTEWSTVELRCDHCRTRHHRVTAYVVRKGEQELLVGSACLKDYTGIDPKYIAMSEELYDLSLNSEPQAYFSTGASLSARVYDAIEVLAQASMIYDTFGYVKSSEPNSNKAKLSDAFLKKVKPTKEAMAKAEALAELIREEQDTEFGRNVNAILDAGYCKREHFGFMAYAPKMADSILKNKRIAAEREARTAEERKASEYVGSVGERLEIVIRECRLLSSWESDFGMTHLYKFLDETGNVFIWFASKMIDSENLQRVKGTIKDHNERDGVKQTIITRCKVA